MTGAGPHARQSSTWAVLEEKLTGHWSSGVEGAHFLLYSLHAASESDFDPSALAGCIHGGGVGAVQIPGAEVAVL